MGHAEFEMSWCFPMCFLGFWVPRSQVPSLLQPADSPFPLPCTLGDERREYGGYLFPWFPPWRAAECYSQDSWVFVSSLSPTSFPLSPFLSSDRILLVLEFYPTSYNIPMLCPTHCKSSTPPVSARILKKPRAQSRSSVGTCVSWTICLQMEQMLKGMVSVFPRTPQEAGIESC